MRQNEPQPIPVLTLPDGGRMPRLGQGSWHTAERPARRAGEIAALRRGVEAGMTLIDSAEMYADTRSESLVGEAIRGIERERLFLVSKVYPHNAGADRIFSCCAGSIERMGAGYLDLYLLHWRGSVPLSETVDCMEELVRRGMIRRWGVANFDLDDMQELWRVPHGDRCAVNQVLYHLGSRGVEFDLLPWMRREGVALMAYCPLAQGGRLRRGLFADPAVRQVAAAHNATPAQILLAFLLHQQGVAAIPQSGSEAHAVENAAAAAIRLSGEELALLDRAFPAPTRKVPLDIQ